MTRRMLINAQSSEQLRVAIVRGKLLENFQMEVSERGLTRGNIYRGKIAAIQPSLNAAFIDYGADRNGFLSIQDVVPEAYYHDPKGGGRAKIEEVLEKGRSIVVQVTKEAEGSKGAVLTTNLSLAGRYIVLTPFAATRGISRKVEDEETRKSLKQQVGKLDIPQGCGVIVRTNALDQNKTALNRDLSALLRLWKRVSTSAQRGKGVQLLYSDQDIILQALRDYLDSSIEEVLVDDDTAYAKAEEYMRAFMPRSKTRLVRYEERTPLFSRYDLEWQIDRIYERRVPLEGGGSLVIDGTEALTAVDVNSGRATGGATQAETAVNTNLEAAGEVARQLRLRDIGGLVVVDFIDMRSRKHQGKVEKTLRDALKDDKARWTVGRISPNGLLEINRQRIHQALHLRTHRDCPTCDGTGRIASPEMVSLTLLRRIEARAVGGTLKGVRVALHPELADSFQNGRRQDLAELEREFELKVEIIASSRLHRSEQEIEWFELSSEERRRRASAPRPAKKAAKPAQLSASVDAGSGDDQDGEVEKKRPRRRRRGRRKPKDPQAEPAAAMESAAGESERPARGRGRRGSGRQEEAEPAAAAAAAQESVSEGRSSEGRVSERASEGRSSEGRSSEGRSSEGRVSERASDRQADEAFASGASREAGPSSEGSAPEGAASEAAAPEGPSSEGATEASGEAPSRPRRRRPRRRGGRRRSSSGDRSSGDRTASDQPLAGDGRAASGEQPAPPSEQRMASPEPHRDSDREAPAAGREAPSTGREIGGESPPSLSAPAREPGEPASTAPNPG